MDRNNKFNTNIPHPQTKSDGLPDIKKIVTLVLRNWYLFVISFPLFMGAVYLHHRYTPVVYKGSVTVMMKSENQRTPSGAAIIEGFGLSPETKSIENQTIILRSKKVIKRVIDRLDFGIDIYSDGTFKDSDMYHRSPFNITMDSTHVQPLNTAIHLEPIGTNQVKIRIESDNALLHTFKDQKNHGGSGLIDFEKTVSWGDEIKTPYCKFIIDRNSRPAPTAEFYFFFRSHDWLASTYRGRVLVNAYKEGSSIIYISTTGTNSHKINTFLKALSDVYIEQSLERKNEIAEKTLAFIDVQLCQVSDTLKETQRKLMEFRRENIFSAPTEISQRLADKYFEYETELNKVKIRKNYYTRLRKHLIEDPVSDDYLLPAFSLDANSLISSFVTELLTLNNERTIMASETSANNPLLNELDKKITVSKENLLLALSKLLKNIDIEEEKLNVQMNNAAAKMNFLPETERQYLDIEREYKLNDAIYTFLLQKQSETQITKASNTPDNEILDNASITGIVAPNKKKNTRQALFIALLLPIGIIFLKEYLNNKIRDKQELLSLTPNASILGYIPEYKGNDNFVIESEPLSSISESFRALRTRLKYLTPQDEKLTITVTSTNTGEGKTFCALNLASAFAISGKKTALVGFDLRKPRLTELFNHRNHLGLSNYLIGQADISEISYPSDLNKLTIIPSGAIPPNPSELISNDNTTKLFNEVKELFDVIIVDSPPIGVVADARLLMEHSNCNLFVARMNKTIKDHFKHTMQNLTDENIGSIGVVLNGLTNNNSGYGYYSEKYYTDSKKSL